MNQLFPMIQPQEFEYTQELPLCREASWDFRQCKPLFKGGNPIYVEGIEAVKVWIWKALKTGRAKYEIYTWDFGSDIEDLIGQNYSDELKRAETIRYVHEALEINPYITEISSVAVSFHGGKLCIDAKISTVYGEVTINV